MEFISAELFLKENEKVQKVFIDWWKPSTGDLFREGKGKYALHKAVYISPNNIGDTNIFCALSEDRFYKKEKVVPLFTEGQLRKFIEDKIKAKLRIIPTNIGYRIIYLPEKGIDLIDKCYEGDLLQVYWQVAVQIAKESIKQ